MGERREILKKIAGHRRNIEKHQRKIEAELASPMPNMKRIELWRKHVANSHRQIDKLERRLRS